MAQERSWPFAAVWPPVAALAEHILSMRMPFTSAADAIAVAAPIKATKPRIREIFILCAPFPSSTAPGVHTPTASAAAQSLAERYLYASWQSAEEKWPGPTCAVREPGLSEEQKKLFRNTGQLQQPLHRPLTFALELPRSQYAPVRLEIQLGHCELVVKELLREPASWQNAIRLTVKRADGLTDVLDLLASQLRVDGQS